MLDASECPPTFRSDPEQVQGVIAGGEAAMFRAKEGAEDDPAGGAADLAARDVAAADAVVGIAAGGTTPYVHGALAEAPAARRVHGLRHLLRTSRPRSTCGCWP